MGATLATYSAEELKEIGLHRIGDNVRIDKTCRLYGAANIIIGSNVRIDAYSVLSASPAGISIGSFVHIGTGVTLLGSGGVTLEDFVGLSARVCVFSSNDDYSGETLTGPTVPNEYRNVFSARVVFRRHAIIGAGSVLLPGVEIGIGAAVGALTLVKKSVPEFTIAAGNPMRIIGKRQRHMLRQEEKLCQGPIL